MASGTLKAGNAETVKLLLQEAEQSPVGYERPASGFPVDNKGCTPIHLVAQEGDDTETLDV
jgi:hypothetical protein